MNLPPLGSTLWKTLDEMASAALAARLANITKENFNKTFKFFEESIYDLSKDLFHIKKERKNRKRPYNKKEKLLKKFRKIKNDARRLYRQRKRENKDFKACFNYMMEAVRAHNTLSKLVQRDSREFGKAKAQKSFMKNPDAFAKNLLSPKDVVMFLVLGDIKIFRTQST